MYHFEKSVLIDCSVEKAFLFHTDTNNLKKISPSSVTVDIRKIELPMKIDSEVELVITQFGIFKSRWKVKIAKYITNEVVGDLMLKGPFKSWYHEHRFKEEHGKIIMTDYIDYELPLGLLGNIANRLFVKKIITNMFEFRHKRTKEVLEN